jgi:hypothetical protein
MKMCFGGFASLRASDNAITFIALFQAFIENGISCHPTPIYPFCIPNLQLPIFPSD